MVKQVPALGILMILNGGLTLVVGVLLMGSAPFAVFVDPEVGPLPQDQVVLNRTALFVMGSTLLANGLLNVMGGFWALKYRRRFLVLAALFSSIGPLVACCCWPTSVGVMIYGLIVIFQPGVIRAFEMGDFGLSTDEIMREMEHPSGSREWYHRDDENAGHSIPPRGSEPPDERIRSD